MMYPGEAPQRYSPAYLEAAQEHARRTGRHKCGKTKGGPPPGFPLGEFGPGAPFPPPGPAVPGSVDDYTAAMAKNYQEYASATMKPEYSAHWAQLVRPALMLDAIVFLLPFHLFFSAVAREESLSPAR